MKKPILSNPVQLGLVVKDVEKTVKLYADALGIGPWKIYHIKHPDSGEIMMIAARGLINNLEIELIESRMDNGVHTEYFNKHGNSMEHLQFQPENFEDSCNALKSMGYKVIREGEYPGGIKFAYFDTQQDLGFISEIAYFPSGAEEQWRYDYTYPAGLS